MLMLVDNVIKFLLLPLSVVSVTGHSLWPDLALELLALFDTRISRVVVATPSLVAPTGQADAYC